MISKTVKWSGALINVVMKCMLNHLKNGPLMQMLSQLLLSLILFLGTINMCVLLHQEGE